MRKMDGHTHQVSESLDRRLRRYQDKFNDVGKCNKHGIIRCERCSRGSSAGSRLSSNDSSNIITAAILRKHRGAPRSEIGFKQASLAKSVSRPMKRKSHLKVARNQSVNRSVIHDDHGRISNSRDRGEVSSLPRDAILASNPLDGAHTTKNKEVRDLNSRLLSYGKSGNRPSAMNLPTNNFAVSEVKINITGRDHSNDSKGYSEYDVFNKR